MLMTHFELDLVTEGLAAACGFRHYETTGSLWPCTVEGVGYIIIDDGQCTYAVESYDVERWLEATDGFYSRDEQDLAYNEFCSMGCVTGPQLDTLVTAWGADLGGVGGDAFETTRAYVD
jgi:hypothetical protein